MVVGAMNNAQIQVDVPTIIVHAATTADMAKSFFFIVPQARNHQPRARGYRQRDASRGYSHLCKPRRMVERRRPLLPVRRHLTLLHMISFSLRIWFQDEAIASR